MKIAKGIVVIACMLLVAGSARGAAAGQSPLPQAEVGPTAGPPSGPSSPEDARSPMASGSSLAVTFGAAPGASLLAVVGIGLIFAPALAGIR